MPFALVIEKGFYKTDVRAHVGNLGGRSTGRVLGKKAGRAVMTLDILKASLVVWIAMYVLKSEYAAAAGGLAATGGHCYPVFGRFKGGKAVATLYGFLFSLVTAASYSPLMFFHPLIVFLIVLYLTKLIALASIVSAAAVTVYAWAAGASLPVLLALGLFTLMIVVRHRANLLRRFRHEENKITWM